MDCSVSSLLTPVTWASENIKIILVQIYLLYSRNLEQMKAWRKGLALLGLRKLVYEKSKHFHGLIFRKPSCLLQTLTKASVREEDGEADPSCLESLFFIPQDKDVPQDEKDQCQTGIVITEDDRQHFKFNFEELPNFDL